MTTCESSEGGASLIEFIIVLPLLLGITCFVIDGSGALQGYVYLNGLSRELARSASGIADLETTDFSFPTNLPPSSSPTKVVYDRAQLLYLIDRNYGDSRLDDLNIQTSNDGTSFTITLSATYNHLLPLNLGFFNFSRTGIAVSNRVRLLY